MYCYILWYSKIFFFRTVNQNILNTYMPYSKYIYKKKTIRLYSNINSYTYKIYKQYLVFKTKNINVFNSKFKLII